tara:strand:- start:44108 stop:45241 length:1134 start_codon:yes stop_codon:yes gene_type:complete
VQPVQRVFIPIDSAITWAAHNVPVVKNLCIKALRGVTGADGCGAAIRIGLGAFLNAVNPEGNAIASLGKRPASITETPEQLFKKQTWVQDILQEVRNETQGLLIKIEKEQDARFKHMREKVMFAEERAVQAEEKAVQAEEKAVQAEEKAAKARDEAAQAKDEAAQAKDKAAQAEEKAAQAGECLVKVHHKIDESQVSLQDNMTKVIQISVQGSMDNLCNEMRKFHAQSEAAPVMNPQAGAAPVMNTQAGVAPVMNTQAGSSSVMNPQAGVASRQDSNLLNIARVPTWINMKVKTKNHIMPILDSLLQQRKSIDLGSLHANINNHGFWNVHISLDELREKMNGKVNRRLIAHCLRRNKFSPNHIKAVFADWGLRYMNE